MNQLLQLPSNAGENGAELTVQADGEDSTTPIDRRSDDDAAGNGADEEEDQVEEEEEEDAYSVATSEDPGEAEEPVEYTSHVEICLLDSQLGCSADAVEVPYIVEE